MNINSTWLGDHEMRQLSLENHVGARHSWKPLGQHKEFNNVIAVWFSKIRVFIWCEHFKKNISSTVEIIKIKVVLLKSLENITSTIGFTRVFPAKVLVNYF